MPLKGTVCNSNHQYRLEAHTYFQSYNNSLHEDMQINSQSHGKIMHKNTLIFNRIILSHFNGNIRYPAVTRDPCNYKNFCHFEAYLMQL